MASDQDYNLSPDALSAMTPSSGDLSARLDQAAQDEAARYRGRVASEQPQIPETPSFGWGGIEPITQPKPQAQPAYDYYGANLESGRNLSRQSFVDSYNKQAAASPWVDTLNAFASAISGRPVSPYNANPANYRQLTPSEEAEKYRRDQSEYAGLAAGIATPELASATGLARFAPDASQLNIFMPAKDLQKTEAIRMEAEGVHPNTIWKQTGAFRDVDGRWLREISDAESRITPQAQQFIKDYESASGPAAEIFEHPELYKQAPGLKKYDVDLEKEPEFITPEHPDYFPGFQQKAEMMEEMGRSPKDIFEQSNMRRTPSGEWEQRYFPLGWHYGEDKVIRATGANPEDFRKTLLHESQHAVDKGMGRPNYGASDDRIYQELAKLSPEEAVARANASRAAGSKWAPNPADYQGNWEGFLRQLASDEYMRNAGEVRARNVEVRRNMSPAERLQTHPFKTMDVPPKNQIVDHQTGATTARSQPVAPEPRSLDQLGYYSQALETAKVLPQAKGTPEQMLAQLKKAGVKDAEIQATNLPQFLEGKKSVTRDEIAQHLEDNRVGLNQATRSEEAIKKLQSDFSAVQQSYLRNEISPEDYRRQIDAVNARMANTGYPQWAEYSLDPSNPTYRETVLHLPASEENVAKAQALAQREKELFDHYSNLRRQGAAPAALDHVNEQLESVQDKLTRLNQSVFRSGHFEEPNITGHLMTSMVKDQNGRNVFNVDQIQSDWGQKLREGGVRDDAKLAKIKTEYHKVNNEFSSLSPEEKYEPHTYGLYEQKPYYYDAPQGQDVRLNDHAQALYDRRALLKAEWETAEQGATGHPLVNTTDQWTNTTLRHAIKQAAESGADAISIPSGKTVLSYNPGDEHGMNEFYGKIVPKNLGKILKKIDPQAPASEYHEQMFTPPHPSNPRSYFEPGRGNGFTVFPLTDKIKQSVLKEGQPLFKRGGSVHRDTPDKSISDATYELLDKLKRQDGGSTSPQHLYDPHPVPKKIPALKNPPQEPSTMATLSALFNNMGLNYNVPPGARESSNIEDLRGHTGSAWAPQAISSPPAPTFSALLQPSIATGYAPELGSSGPSPFEPFMYPMKP